MLIYQSSRTNNRFLIKFYVCRKSQIMQYKSRKLRIDFAAPKPIAMISYILYVVPVQTNEPTNLYSALEI